MAISGRYWPFHLKPLDDELLSCWIVRLARAHGMRLHTFCDLAWRRRQIWNRDIDKLANNRFLRILARKTATSFKRVRRTTLRAYEGWLYEKHNPLGNTKWIMPIGVYHRTRNRYGLQFCARCLRQDPEPYFRRNWRLAFVTVCQQHGLMLLDRCPKCGMPVMFYRSSPDAETITLCARCGFDLRRVSALQKRCAERQLKNQQRLLAIVERGWVEIPGFGPVYSHLWFDVLHQMMKLLLTGRRTKKLRSVALKETRTRNFCPRGRDLEREGVEERAKLVVMALWLLDNWPRTFHRACQQSGVLSSALLRDLHRAPFWYWHVVRNRFYDASYSPSDEEIRSVARWLTSKGNKATEKDISALIGVRQVFRKRVLMLEKVLLQNRKLP